MNLLTHTNFIRQVFFIRRGSCFQLEKIPQESCQTKRFVLHYIQSEEGTPRRGCSR